LRRLLSVFERQRAFQENNLTKPEFNKPIILIGSHRIGQSIAFNLQREDFLIIDYDPDIISQLKKYNYLCLFADISDVEIFERVDFSKARLVISTSPHFEDNLILLNALNLLKKEKGKGPQVILRSQDEKEAEILYQEGVDYALLPHFTSGQYLGKTIAIDPELKILEQLKNRDLALIKKLKHET
jgi:Trk K+ transport system NAD-binding subunit